MNMEKVITLTLLSGVFGCFIGLGVMKQSDTYSKGFVYSVSSEILIESCEKELPRNLKCQIVLNTKVVPNKKVKE